MWFDNVCNCKHHPISQTIHFSFIHYNLNPIKYTVLKFTDFLVYAKTYKWLQGAQVPIAKNTCNLCFPLIYTGRFLC